MRHTSLPPDRVKKPLLYFLKAGDHLVPISSLVDVCIERVEQGVVVLEYQVGDEIRRAEAHGFDAIDAVMALRRSALEGLRFRYNKHAWAVHNMIGHPLMQIFAWAGAYKAAMWVHDATAPTPHDFHPKVQKPEVSP